jgi:hypothetical protein
MKGLYSFSTNMKVCFTAMFFSIWILGHSLTSCAQVIPMTGDTFWTVFTTFGTPNPRFCICSEQETNGVIYFFKDSNSVVFEIGKDTCIFINNISQSVNGGVNLAINPLGILVTASKPVTLYRVAGLFSTNANTYSNNTWPSQAQSVNYLISTYTGDLMSTYLFAVGRSDSTECEITLSIPVPGLSPPGVPFIKWLNKGDVYLLGYNQGDLSGTRVRSLPVNGVARPITVYSMRHGLGGPGMFWKRDPTNSMELPVDNWGNRFHTSPHLTRKGDVIRILANDDSTEVEVNGIPSFWLNAGQFADTVLTTAVKLVSSHPVSVMMHSRDMPTDTVMNSSAFRYPVLSDENKVTRAVFTSDRYSDSTGVITNYYLNLVCKTANTGMVRLDGISIGNQFIPYTADPQWSYAQMPVTKGLHILEADSGVLGYYYAYGYVMGYGHLIAGSNQVLTGVVQMPDKASTIMVYPNPMSSALWVQAAGMEAGNTLITVTGIHGREEYRHEAVFGSTNWQHEISTGHLARGVYFVRVQSGNSVKVLKVVKM